MWVYGVGGVGTDALMLLHACSSSTLRISHLDQLVAFRSVRLNQNLCIRNRKASFFCIFLYFFLGKIKEGKSHYL